MSIFRTPTPSKKKKITIAAAATAAMAGAAGTVAAAEDPGATPGVRQVSAADAAALSTWPDQAMASHSQLDAVAVVRATTSAARAIRRLSPRQIARSLLPAFHWPASQFGYLTLLWDRESGWQVHAANPTTGAYGIPQAVPGDKMATAGANWATSARTQVRWGLSYIKATYGSPYEAWQHELADGWY